MKECTHPAICNGVCLVCHKSVENKPQEHPDNIADSTAVETPEMAQETPKKATRKRKA